MLLIIHLLSIIKTNDISNNNKLKNMGLLTDYKGGVNVEDYKLVDHGEGDGFGIESQNCVILNDSEARVYKGLIELTISHASMSRGLTLADSDRVILSAEDAEDLIQVLQEALEEADPQQWELRESSKKKTGA